MSSDASFSFAITSIEATIIAIGIIGNILSILVFSRKTFRNNSISTYCIALSIVECLNLIQLANDIYSVSYTINLPDVSDSLCKFTFSNSIFIASIHPCILVAFSVDKLLSMRTRSIAMLKKKWFQWSLVAAIVLLNTALYIYIPILIKLGEIFPGYFICDLSTIGFFQIFMIEYIVESCFIPFIIMIVSSILTIRLLIKSRNSVERIGSLNKERKTRDTKYAISSLTFNFTFIALKMPSAIFYTLSAYISYYNLYYYKSSLLLYYLNMSISFFVHFMSNSLFRRELLVLLRLKSRTETVSNSRTNRVNQVSIT